MGGFLDALLRSLGRGASRGNEQDGYLHAQLGRCPGCQSRGFDQHRYAVVAVLSVREGPRQRYIDHARRLIEQRDWHTLRAEHGVDGLCDWVEVAALYCPRGSLAVLVTLDKFEPCVDDELIQVETLDPLAAHALHALIPEEAWQLMAAPAPA